MAPTWPETQAGWTMSAAPNNLLVKARYRRRCGLRRLPLQVVQNLTTYTSQLPLAGGFRGHVPQPASWKAGESTQHRSTGREARRYPECGPGRTSRTPTWGIRVHTARDLEKPGVSAADAGSPAPPDVPPLRTLPLTFNSAESLFPHLHPARSPSAVSLIGCP